MSKLQGSGKPYRRGLCWTNLVNVSYKFAVLLPVPPRRFPYRLGDQMLDDVPLVVVPHWLHTIRYAMNVSISRHHF
jgi:hypothetical protein